MPGMATQFYSKTKEAGNDLVKACGCATLLIVHCHHQLQSKVFLNRLIRSLPNGDILGG